MAAPGQSASVLDTPLRAEYALTPQGGTTRLAPGQAVHVGVADCGYAVQGLSRACLNAVKQGRALFVGLDFINEAEPGDQTLYSLPLHFPQVDAELGAQFLHFLNTPQQGRAETVKQLLFRDCIDLGHPVTLAVDGQHYAFTVTEQYPLARTDAEVQALITHLERRNQRHGNDMLLDLTVRTLRSLLQERQPVTP